MPTPKNPAADPPQRSRPVDFGANLERMIGARGLTKARFAKLAGISIATLARALASDTCTINHSSVLNILRALAQANPMLTTQEAEWLATQSGLDRVVALSFVPAAPTEADVQQIDRQISELMTSLGPRGLSAALGTLLMVINAAKQPRAPRSPSTILPENLPNPKHIVLKTKAVQREGFIEHTEIDYTAPQVAPPPPPSDRRSAPSN